MQKIPVKSANTTESDISEFAWPAVSGIKVVPIMAQVAASGLTIRWREVPKIAYTSNGRIAAYKPTTGSKPISSAYAMAVGNATAATDTPATASCRSHSRRYSSKFRSPGATRRREGIFLRVLEDFSIHPRSKSSTVANPGPVCRSNASPAIGSFITAKQ